MWTAYAPSNIALIKYMGKEAENIPINASLSYTLNQFTTTVTMELSDTKDTVVDVELTVQEVERFLRHLNYIKQLTEFNGYFSIKSYNNFPKSVGIASSASSFAALTKCAFKSICTIKNIPVPSMEYMSSISRRASGSSCRSFFEPWCIWDRECTQKIDIKPSKILHDLIMVDDIAKTISSSEAHRLVRTSLLLEGRAQRANNRCEKLIYALNHNNWYEAYQLCWEDFSDMHAMFETSYPHFGYMNYKTAYILTEIRKFWKNHNVGPIATVDAGPNVHLLWQTDSDIIRNYFNTQLISNAFFNIKIISGVKEE